MAKQLIAFIALALKGGVRDRILAAILIVGALLLLTTPVVGPVFHAPGSRPCCQLLSFHYKPYGGYC